MQSRLDPGGLLTAEVVNEPDQPISVLCRASPHHSNLGDICVSDIQVQGKNPLHDNAQESSSPILDVTSALKNHNFVPFKGYTGVSGLIFAAASSLDEIICVLCSVPSCVS